MPFDRLAAIDDRAVAARAFLRRGADARQFAFLDQLEADAFARRHQRDGEGRFGEAVAGAEAGRLEAGVGEAVDERLHDVGADHVGAIAGDAPADRSKRSAARVCDDMRREQMS